jgi:nucleoside-diphosphate-sugar epimerase
VADNFTPRPVIQINQAPDRNKRVERYVPSVEKAKNELGLVQEIMLPDAVKRTVAFLKKTSSGRMQIGQDKVAP